MNNPRLLFFLVILFISTWTLTPPPAKGQFGEIFDRFKKVEDPQKTLSEDKIIQGLKEALQVGTERAVEFVSRADGYYKNPKIKISLPPAIEKVEKILRTTGYAEQVDAFEVSMNRAAEKASSEAKVVFWDAIKGMTISDGEKILKGPDNAATLFFKEKTYDRLNQTFKPIVHDAMAEVGVTSAYQTLNAQVKTLPLVGNMVVDLDQYVTNGALDGLFLMLAEEEKKIRKDPAARVTDLLKTVFKKR